MENRNIIVVGASAGGFRAIQQLVNGLPADFEASIFIVWHMSPDIRGILAEVLGKIHNLTVSNAVDNEPIRTRHIYVAPPDHHLLIDKGLVRVTRGPKENGFRPAVDPLFRSAALAYGSRVIGVILSGALDDGSAGLWAIKQQGGLAIVQDPSEAEVSSMPANAINAVEVDYILPVEKMGPLMAKLITNQPSVILAENNDTERISLEVGIAMGNNSLQHNILGHGELTPFTCPECHGVLTSLREGDRFRFRCHTGHAFSADSLLSSLTANIEETLWTAVRSVQESVLLLNRMGDHFAGANQPKSAALFFQKAREAARREELLRKAVFNHEQLDIETIAGEPPIKP